MTMKTVTYTSPNGHCLDICERCTIARRSNWPRDPMGQEYCTVSHGAHRGGCDLHDPDWGMEAAQIMVARQCPNRANDLWDGANIGSDAPVTTAQLLAFGYPVCHMDYIRAACRLLREGKTPEGWIPVAATVGAP